VEIDGEQRAFGGQIITFDPAAELSFSNNWESDGWSVPTLIAIRLTALYNACRVGLFHHGFERLGADAATQLQGYEAGWDSHHLDALKAIMRPPNQQRNARISATPTSAARHRTRRTTPMAIEVGKDSIDIGIVVRDGEAALKFYRDTLGFEHIADTPAARGGTMHRLMCGTTMVKVVSAGEPPEATNPPGGPGGGTGIRYWTITVPDLAAITEKCRAGGYAVPVEPREIRPGVRISMVEDPEGNWLEFLENNE